METDKAHILVVDDDTRLRSLLQRFLRENDFYVSVAKDAAEARERLSEYKFDLLIVDIMMPNENGLDFLGALRQESMVPVILLTAMGETADRIAGLETGADDYLAKPFEPKELVLRIRNILKRAPKENALENQVLDLGLCLYDMEKKELSTKQNQIIHITPVEQLLLSVLGQKAGQVFHVKNWRKFWGPGKVRAQLTCRLPGCVKKLKEIPKIRVICKPCAERGICCFPNNKGKRLV